MKTAVATLTLFVALVLVGCATTEADIEEGWPYEGSYWYVDAEQLFSEENYQRLGELFEETEAELNRFIEYLRANELLFTVKGARIVFPENEESGDISVGGLRGHSSDGSRYLVRLFADGCEFSDILHAIGDDNIVLDILIQDRSDTTVDIIFMVRRELTYFIQGNHGAPSFFVYYEGNLDPERFGRRRIREGWYIYIPEPPG